MAEVDRADLLELDRESARLRSDPVGVSVKSYRDQESPRTWTSLLGEDSPSVPGFHGQGDAWLAARGPGPERNPRKACPRPGSSPNRFSPGSRCRRAPTPPRVGQVLGLTADERLTSLFSIANLPRWPAPESSRAHIPLTPSPKSSPGLALEGDRVGRLVARRVTGSSGSSPASARSAGRRRPWQGDARYPRRSARPCRRPGFRGHRPLHPRFDQGNPAVDRDLDKESGGSAPSSSGADPASGSPAVSSATSYAVERCRARCRAGRPGRSSGVAPLVGREPDLDADLAVGEGRHVGDQLRARRPVAASRAAVARGPHRRRRP